MVEYQAAAAAKSTATRMKRYVYTMPANTANILVFVLFQVMVELAAVLKASMEVNQINTSKCDHTLYNQL